MSRVKTLRGFIRKYFKLEFVGAQRHSDIVFVDQMVRSHIDAPGTEFPDLGNLFGNVHRCMLRFRRAGH